MNYRQYTLHIDLVNKLNDTQGVCKLYSFVWDSGCGFDTLYITDNYSVVILYLHIYRNDIKLYHVLHITL